MNLFISGINFLFAGFCGYLTYESMPNPSTLTLLPMVFFVILGTVFAVPGLPRLISERLKNLKVSWKNGEGEVNLDFSDQKPGEKPLPDSAEDSEVAKLEERVSGQTNLEEIIEETRPTADSLWGWAIREVERKNFERARRILDAALRRYEDNPKLLIASGYVWSRIDTPNSMSALQDFEKAIRSSENNPDFEEQYYLASSNLCHFLARHKLNKNKALESGKKASDNADRFKNRDSFKINYGFAQLQFANNNKELAEALIYLLRLLGRDLSKEEREEINSYILLGAQNLSRLN